MRARVSRWGNSLAIRIPAAFAEETQIEDGSTVDVAVEDGRLVIAAVSPRYSLEELLAQVTPENVHKETDWGKAVGAEVW